MAGFFYNESPVKVFKMNSSISPHLLLLLLLFAGFLLVGIMSDEQIGNPFNCVMQRGE
jgi:hypothetical protein